MLCHERTYPLGNRSEDVPAFAEEDRRRMRVTLAHPSNDPKHPNLLAAAARYMHKRYTVTLEHAEVVAAPVAPPRRRAA